MTSIIQKLQCTLFDTLLTVAAYSEVTQAAEIVLIF